MGKITSRLNSGFLYHILVALTLDENLPTSGNRPLSSEKKGIISVVDDQIDISKLFRLALAENIEGYDIVSFNDPIIALEHFLVNKSSYALIITDLRMSGLNGLELLKKVKEENSTVRTILMSAFNFEEVKSFQEYMELGVIDSTIEKPITIQRLTHRVRDELQIHVLLNASTKSAVN